MEVTTRVHPTGILRIHELPRDCTEHDYAVWWQRISRRERARYLVAESHNQLTQAGYASVLNFLASSGAIWGGFAQVLAIGNGVINAFYGNVTALSGEFYRVAPVLSSTVGVDRDLVSYVGPSVGNGTYTNAGLWGNGATMTLGSGTLNTIVVLDVYQKASGVPISLDYVLAVT